MSYLPVKFTSSIVRRIYIAAVAFGNLSALPITVLLWTILRTPGYLYRVLSAKKSLNMYGVEVDNKGYKLVITLRVPPASKQPGYTKKTTEQ